MRCVYKRLYSTETIPGFQMEMGVSTMHGRIKRSGYPVGCFVQDEKTGEIE